MQGTEFGITHAQRGHGRVICTDSGDEDDSASTDSTLTVERIAINAQNELMVIETYREDDTHDLEYTRWGPDRHVHDTASGETLEGIIQPDETAERDPHGNMHGEDATEQQDADLHCQKQTSETAQGVQLSDTSTPVLDDGQNQLTADDSNFNDLPSHEDDEDNEDRDSPWQSEAGSGDEDADAHDREVAEGFGQLSRKDIIVDPVIGQVYQCSWPEDGDSIQPFWYFVTRLPFGECNDIGISGRLPGSPLCDETNFPSCCTRPTDDQGPVTWAPGFEYGGPHAFRRKVPCLFLQDGLEIPPSTHEFSIAMHFQFTAWVNVKDLRLQDYQHLSDHDLTGLTEGAAVVEAFKSRLGEIQASRAAGRQFQYPSASPCLISAAVAGTTGVELVSSHSHLTMHLGHR